MHSKISRVITIKIISPANQQNGEKELKTTKTTQLDQSTRRQERSRESVGKVDGQHDKKESMSISHHNKKKES